MVKRLSVESPSRHLLLGVLLSLLVGVVHSARTSEAGSTFLPTTPTTPTTSTTPTTPSTPSTTSTTSRTRRPPEKPENVGGVDVVTQNETSITLQWKTVADILEYTLNYTEKGESVSENVTAPPDQPLVQYVVSPLTAGTNYPFTLFTVDLGLTSTGYNFSALTAPRNVESVTVEARNEISLTVRWDKVDDVLRYRLDYSENGKNESVNVNGTPEATSVEALVSPLTAGTNYSFTLFTLFEEVPSRGFAFTALTAPRNTDEIKTAGQTETSISLEWTNVTGVDGYILVYDGKEINVDATEVTRTISDLTSGTRYSFTLFSVIENVRSSGKSHLADTAPENVKNVTIASQSETSVTLTWDRVKNFTYIVQFDETADRIHVGRDVSPRATSVTRVVHLPHAGTEYSLTLITVFEGINSTGYTFNATTVPPQVPSITLVRRQTTSVTLQWEKVNPAWQYLFHIDGRTVPVSHQLDFVLAEDKNLSPGTEYNFSVITEFKGLNSTAYEGFTVTTIDCSTVNWRVTSTSIRGTVEGAFTSSSATNETHSHDGGGQKDVSFSGLYPGAAYEIRLSYNRTPTPLEQCSHTVRALPADLKGHCEYAASGYSVRVVWDEPFGVWTGVEVNVSGRRTLEEEGRWIVVDGFQPAKTYQVSLGLISLDARSQTPFVFDCSTDPRGVIAGSVVGVLVFIMLACVIAFIIRRRPDIIRGKKSFLGRSKQSIRKSAPISVAKFPDHFDKMSKDENRGFSLEYESLSPVGTEQTYKVSMLPENSAKNRFTNVLPYDWNRVKLSTSDPAQTTDYINASYMPGYNSNREFIATQGPLPSTVVHFWRMIWEQRVRGVVMVTNCKESGRTKCEQYWPADSQPQLFGELSVTTSYEQPDTNWTLREFKLKHKTTSEERTVKHFHFTAWPDHGVPEGTEVLIQFRELVRQHIDRQGTEVPTVVHCSAGVGRTGTLIALDTLLQQLERERAVGINAFVHKMRLNRTFMVQTESQYVFLHQCIMDSLQPKQNMDEHIYENTDMIYVNATALQELHRST